MISYAHESEPHKAQVRELVTALSENGIDVDFDMKHIHRRMDWGLWVENSITTADYVIVVASDTYRRAARCDDGTHPGVQFEAAILRDLLHGDRATWLRKILPVVLPGHRIDHVPLFLQPRVASRYVVDSIDAAGLTELLGVLTGRPDVW